MQIKKGFFIKKESNDFFRKEGQNLSEKRGSKIKTFIKNMVFLLLSIRKVVYGIINKHNYNLNQNNRNKINIYNKIYYLQNRRKTLFNQNTGSNKVLICQLIHTQHKFYRIKIIINILWEKKKKNLKHRILAVKEKSKLLATNVEDPIMQINAM